ncbi:hypothetical protein ACOSP7_014082 [Xanthoceras sorbifolium]
MVSLDPSNFKLACLIIWSIWNDRNQCLFRNQFKSADEVVSSSIFLLEEFASVCTLSTLVLPATPSAANMVVWRAPAANYLKINVDVAFGSALTVGIDAVLRDHLGSIKGSFALPRVGCFSADVGEVFAIREVLSAVVEAGLVVHIVESDSLIAINYINHKSLSASAQPLVDDIVIFSSCLGELSFSHTHRTGNKVAHGLAKYAISLSADKFWVDSCPGIVSALVSLDLNQ